MAVRPGSCDKTGANALRLITQIQELSCPGRIGRRIAVSARTRVFDDLRPCIATATTISAAPPAGEANCESNDELTSGLFLEDRLSDQRQIAELAIIG